MGMMHSRRARLAGLCLWWASCAAMFVYSLEALAEVVTVN
jgi:hypothetical protein